MPLLPHQSARRLGLLLVLILSAVGLASCEGLPRGGRMAPFGLDGRTWTEIVARGDKRALLALDAADLAVPGPGGAAAWFAAALWLEEGGFDGSPEERRAWRLRVIDLYGRSAGGAMGLVRDESLARLAKLLAAAAAEEGEGRAAAAAWEAALALPRPADRDNADIGILRLEALAALGRYGELLGEAADFARRKTVPAVAGAGATGGAALFFEGLAKRRLGREDWDIPIGSLLGAPPGPWVFRGIDLALEAAGEATDIDPARLAMARLRREVAGRDYAAAWRLAKAAEPALRAPPAGRDLVADFAKAFLHSGMSAQGLALMDSLGAGTGTARGAGEGEWTAAWYKARMLRTLGRLDAAKALFDSLAAVSAGRVDRDSARWYSLDCSIQALEAAASPEKAWTSPAARSAFLARAKLGLLEAGSATWEDPSMYDDISAPLLRALVQGGDWRSVEAFSLALSDRLGPELAARSLYLAGRARELGLVGDRPRLPLAASQRDSAGAAAEAGPARPSDGILAAARFASVLALPSVSEYYRLVASSRLGRDLFGDRASPALPPSPPPPRRADPEGDRPWSRGGTAESLRSLLGLGLPTLAWNLASGRIDGLLDEELRGLALAYAGAGRPSDSMRFAQALLSRGAKAGRRELGLLYPRPWLPEIRAATGNSGIPEWLALGLLRSESWFRPDIRSRAGAVGLAQLMPATAEELARKLRLDSWDLAEPADNIRLGMAMFRDLLLENDGHSLRALFAYNAGRARLRRWLAEAGGVPDDLLLEALAIEETRQYGRNIVVAGTWYAFLYYGRGSATAVRDLVGGIEGIR